MAATGITYQSQTALNTGNTTPHGMTEVPVVDRVFIANNGDDSNYKYTTGLVFDKKVSLPSGNTLPRGLAYVESRGEVWALDQSAMYRINPLTDTSPGSYALHADNDHGEGILYFPSIDEVWVLDRVDKKFYRYNATTGASLGTYNLHASNSDGRGACHVAGEAWVLNASDKKIYRYSATGASLGTYDLSTLHQTPRAMARVGDDFWVADNGNNSVFEYTLDGLSKPVIPAIATQNIVINETTEFVLNIDVTGATSCEVEGDLEEFYATFDPTLSSNRLKFRGIPKQLLSDKVVTIKATNADGTTTASFIYNVVPAAPIITRPTGRIKFVRGLPANLFIPVANKPGNFNAYGLQVGLGHKLEEAGGRITGAIPNETKLVASSGLLDFEASNNGGVDTENDVPFDVLTSAPGTLSSFTATAAFKSITLSSFSVTDARGYAIKIWKSSDAEPSDTAAGAWTDIGAVTTHTVTGLELGVAHKVKMRVNAPWVGAASAAQTVTPLNYVSLHANNQKACGITLQGDSILIHNYETSGSDTVFFYDPSDFSYEKVVSLTNFTSDNTGIRIEATNTYFYLVAFHNSTNRVYVYKYNSNFTYVGRYLVRSGGSHRFVEGLAATADGLWILVRDGSYMDYYAYDLGNNQVSLPRNNFTSVASLRGSLFDGDESLYSYYYGSGASVLRKYYGGKTYQSGQDISLPIPSIDCRGLAYDASTKTLYLLTYTRLYVVENITL